MAAPNIKPTQNERFFDDDQIIVSKTDVTGRITYANDVFITTAQYTEEELLGAQHSIVRHPAMPRCVFKLLWDTLAADEEIFAYVKNMAKNGDYYWVFAHVTPSYDVNRNLVGYHSNRRTPERSAIDAVDRLYAQLLAEENRHTNKKVGMEASFAMVVDLLEQNGVSYEEFVFSL